MLKKLKCFVGMHKMIFPEAAYKKRNPGSNFVFLALNIVDEDTGLNYVDVQLNVKYCDICGKAELYTASKDYEAR